LRQLADRLPVDTRLATVESIVLPFEWVPVQHVIAWHEALWNGLARADESELARLVARSMELGLARFKSAFFAGITPTKLVERGPELWRWLHTHGTLSASLDGQTAAVTLTDHPYVENGTSRRLTAESYRYIVMMVGGRDARAAWSAVPRGHGGTSGTGGNNAHASGRSPANGSLVVRLTWRLA
jgi:hypothetical protein